MVSPTQFLKQTKVNFEMWKETQEEKVLNIILGNEGADMDSIICAIVYAYCCVSEHLILTDGQPGSILFVPVINCAKEDLKLRRDVLKW
jgi:exopolyphosphatase